MVAYIKGRILKLKCELELDVFLLKGLITGMSLWLSVNNIVRSEIILWFRHNVTVYLLSDTTWKERRRH